MSEPPAGLARLRERSFRFPALRWPMLDLKTRLSLFIAGLLGAVLLFAVLAVLSNSRRAVNGEMDAVLRLATNLLAEAGPADAPLEAGLLQVLRHTRHLCVDDGAAGASGTRACPAAVDEAVPDWFAAHVTVPPRELRRDFRAADGRLLPVAIRTDPAEEILEGWREARPLLLLIVAIGLLTNVIVVVTIWRAFRPIEQIRDALARLGCGETRPGLPRTSTPELRAIVDSIVVLDAQLEQGRADNRRLLRQSLEVQERERRALARELHDEIGQRLAAMDADAALLQQLAPPGDERLRARTAAIRTGIAGLYDGVHGLLARLRPAGLEEFGLGSALQNLVDGWAGRRPDLRFETRIDLERLPAGALAEAHLFRIAQEALTNAARHAAATRVSLSLCCDSAGAVHLRVADDGRGLPADLIDGAGRPRARPRAGLGLLGIRERAEMIGAELRIGAAADGGTVLSLRCPPA